MKLNPKTIKLWKDMYDLTYNKCKETCNNLGSCCSEEYCLMAEKFAEENGIILEHIKGGKLPFLGPNGCIVPPHLRQLCTLHQCKIQSLGFYPNDQKWTTKCFNLREKLEYLAFEEE